MIKYYITQCTYPRWYMRFTYERRFLNLLLIIPFYYAMLFAILRNYKKCVIVIKHFIILPTDTVLQVFILVI